MLCEVTRAKQAILYEVTECKTCLLVAGENMDVANGPTGVKNRSSTFELTAFISFGLFNIFRPHPVAQLAFIHR
jgi:hypothetical protein